MEKCGVWLAHGSQCAWASDPDERTVALFRPAMPPEVVRGHGRATAAPTLPDFVLEIATLFDDLD